MSELKIKKTDAELKKTLEEMYRMYFQLARKFSNEADEEAGYMEAKSHGGIEAIEAVYLWLYGGDETYKLWQGEVNRYDETAGG